MAAKLADTEYGEGKGQPAKAAVVVLSDEQFSKLVELLTPGFEASKMMLAEMQLRSEARAADEKGRADAAEYYAASLKNQQNPAPPSNPPPQTPPPSSA